MEPGDTAPENSGEAYSRGQNHQLSQETRRLWQDVANGIDKSQTVVWKNAVDSLDQAYRHLGTNKEARLFIEKYMRPVISILLEQQPAKIGQIERSCVEDSLERAILIISDDLVIQQKRNGECLVLDVLAAIFNRKKTYYKGSKMNWNANLSGLPEVRGQMIDRFRNEKGFARLADYLATRANLPNFPSLELLHHILLAIGEAVPNRSGGSDKSKNIEEIEEDAIMVAKSVMDYIANASDDSLKRQSHDSLSTVRYDLQRIFDRLVSTRRKRTYEFYQFWRQLTLKLITSQSLPLKLFGWDQVTDLIEASAEHRPPPKSFIVSGAGCTFLNGLYTFCCQTTSDGYAQQGVEISYERIIPDSDPVAGGKKLTLFRCTMRSQQKWWFLSEADEEQPGTDKDIDYYQHKSKQNEETEPPRQGWVTCRNAGVEPAPTLQGRGLMVPPGEEYNTLEHQLAEWAIGNGIIQMVLGDSRHREVVARSTPLIKFLAAMCNRDEPLENVEHDTKATGVGPNAYSLQLSHLLLAWRTCTSKADAAVSDEVYQLLVSILPCLPDELAIPLLEAIQSSLRERSEKRDHLFEVAEFCSALASSSESNANGGNTIVLILSEKVRAEVLKLLWSVLTHSDASSLKSYENLKRYVTSELQVEPKGSEHRETFLDSCRLALSKNSQEQHGESTDEALALRMTRLTRFVLESCPRDQAIRLVAGERGALPALLYSELVAYLTRRNANGITLVTRKQASMSSSHSSTAVEATCDHAAALSERLRILRYAFGLSDHVKMDSQQLTQLWKLCSKASDREALMVFIADASSSGRQPNNNSFGFSDSPTISSQNDTPTQEQEDPMLSSFSDEVRTFAFKELFCSDLVNWDELGEHSYHSFQTLFQKVKQSPTVVQSPNVDGPALDALWRICLCAGNDAVASQGMRDLLAVYVSMAEAADRPAQLDDRHSAIEVMQADSEDENFGDRIFNCLVEVKEGLEHGNVSSERSAERCLRILNAAVGQDGSSRASLSAQALSSLSPIPSSEIQNFLNSLPHGMRSQSCYRRVGIMAKRTASSNHAGPTSIQATRGTEEMSDLVPTTVAGQQSNVHHSSSLRFPLDVHPLETLNSVKEKVARYCKCSISSVKPISVSGHNRETGGDSSQMSLSLVPVDSLMDSLGIVQGCEMVFLIAERQGQTHFNDSTKRMAINNKSAFELSKIFRKGPDGLADRLFETLLSVLEALPTPSTRSVDTHCLVWDLLLALPTNAGIAETLRSCSTHSESVFGDDDAMRVDARESQWSNLLDLASFHHSVYAMQVIDSLLQPAPEVVCSLPVAVETQERIKNEMRTAAIDFRHAFINSGGFDAVVQFFSTPGQTLERGQTSSMGNAVALRILKCCMLGNTRLSHDDRVLDETGTKLLNSLSDAEGLLKSLTAMVVEDNGISSSAIADVLKFLRLLFRSPRTTECFMNLPDDMAEKFLITLLLWKGETEVSPTASESNASSSIRRSSHDIILTVPLLATNSLPWLINAMDTLVEVTSDDSAEYFDVLKKLVQGSASSIAEQKYLCDLGTEVCKKIASCPRPSSDSASIDISTGVLCGCLKVLRAIIEKAGGAALAAGSSFLLDSLNVRQWSEQIGTLEMDNHDSYARVSPEDQTLIDLMGAIFDGLLSPGGYPSVVAICCDRESRQLGFDVVAAAARSCEGRHGYLVLVSRIQRIIDSAASFLRHRWGQSAGLDEGFSKSIRSASKYSGLRNQGCTCYMNSFLQQLFMMPGLRNNLCAATIPACLRTSGGGMFAKGAELVGKRITLQWESGVSYDATVEGFNEKTGMHTIHYCPMHLGTNRNSGHHQVHPEDTAKIPPEMPDEFFLSEGRPGKETGVFEIVSSSEMLDGREGEGESGGKMQGRTAKDSPSSIKETEDEVSSRHLLEEVQRTFIHLDEGSRGRCFDPRALVEACNCLKLEFDVWQQNDASEFAMKLLDRLEISLKRWAPDNFRYLEHTFGLKQTKQKVCKDCGHKTNREENLMSIDCQIRGKTDIHEALSTMCEVEYMEGDNRVYCDRCKKNTDTVLRTAISALPDMLILSLKRFDLDYNTFETVKLNSRCEFGHTLNMKKYTLEGVEALEKANLRKNHAMVTDENEEKMEVDPLSSIPDDDYEYRLAGVLVHAGVAQGGHYYSFIKDRLSGVEPETEKWYRFDDEDVTPFDPSSIEAECFGGKFKKETKWPNGQVHTVESEQFANALMIFYEKVKTQKDSAECEGNGKGHEDKEEHSENVIEKTSGFDVFEPDVRRSNATHRWQTFLFDVEFQRFLKGLLGLCMITTADEESMVVSGSTSMANPAKEYPWGPAVVQLLLSFFYDILLYSSEKQLLEFWAPKLSDVLIKDARAAKIFVSQLAMRTQEISSNWLRNYVTDCSEAESRIGAVRIFNAAIQTCASIKEEQARLKLYTQAWKEQLSTQLPGVQEPLPTRLDGFRQSPEDPRASSSLGVIMSYLSELLEVAPRALRHNSELCLLIRELSSSSPELGGSAIREAIIQMQIPARLICLVIRERAPAALKSSFPGSSASVETVETQSRTETNPSHHLLPINGNQVMNADINSRGPSAVCTSTATDYLTLYESLGCLFHLEGIKRSEVIAEWSIGPRRQNISLTPAAAEAFKIIFQEACSSGGSGMGQHDIEAYLQKTGVDSSTVPRSKIVDILTKYPSNGAGKDLKGSSLGVDGFLAYYRDTTQTNEVHVRSDLNLFGFRSDLSRRPQEASSSNETAESVASDVTNQLERSGRTTFGRLAELGFQSYHFFAFAYSANEPLAEHILAAAVHNKDSSQLILGTLKALYRAPNGWAGNETLGAVVMILKVLAAVPDSHQHERISMIMQCAEKPNMHTDHGVGLLVVAKLFYGSRPTHHYPTEYHYSFDRYVEVIKELFKLKEVVSWMTNRKQLWSWLERELVSIGDSSSRHQMCGDFTDRRDNGDPAVPLDHNQSDSDMPCINDSEDDDDDSRYDGIDACSANDGRVYVDGSGVKVINGIYEPSGTFDHVGKYVKEGMWKERLETFSLFRCHVSDNTKRWYISIVPKNVQPGTNTDIDFYSAPVVDDRAEYPPVDGWTKAGEGLDPPPQVIWKADEQEPRNKDGNVWMQNNNQDVIDEGGSPNHGNGRIYI